MKRRTLFVCLLASLLNLDWLLSNRCLHLVALRSLIYPTASVPSHYGFKISEPLTGYVSEQTKSLSAKLCEIGESRRKAQRLIFGPANSRRTCLGIDNNKGRQFKMVGKPLLVNTHKQKEPSTVFPVHADVSSCGRGATYPNVSVEIYPDWWKNRKEKKKENCCIGTCQFTNVSGSLLVLFGLLDDILPVWSFCIELKFHWIFASLLPVPTGPCMFNVRLEYA